MIVMKRLSVWLAIAGVGFAGWVLMGANQKDPMPPPISEPPRSPYERTVAASGIIEAVNENVRIAPPVAGLITKVFVKVGDQVTEQSPLFQLDDRELHAHLLTREAAIPHYKRRLKSRNTESAISRLNSNACDRCTMNKPSARMTSSEPGMHLRWPKEALNVSKPL
ncbi:MAG: biotin/lipoyl-binding protein [Nitrospira sp.]|nr:biotin/lipoyl-binding protein [Nitrospira sp.]